MRSVRWCERKCLTRCVKRVPPRDRQEQTVAPLPQSVSQPVRDEKTRCQADTEFCARYSLGAMPVQRLNARVKALCCEKPSRKVTSVME